MPWWTLPAALPPIETEIDLLIEARAAEALREIRRSADQARAAVSRILHFPSRSAGQKRRFARERATR
jgi:hypothetical protein